MSDEREHPGDYHPGADAIQVMTMKVSKGLEFPVVALPGVGHMPVPGEAEKEAARVFYVAATRATQRLVMCVGGMENLSESCELSGDSCVIVKLGPKTGQVGYFSLIRTYANAPYFFTL